MTAVWLSMAVPASGAPWMDGFPTVTRRSLSPVSASQASWREAVMIPSPKGLTAKDSLLAPAIRPNSGDSMTTSRETVGHATRLDVVERRLAEDMNRLDHRLQDDREAHWAAISEMRQDLGVQSDVQAQLEDLRRELTTLQDIVRVTPMHDVQDAQRDHALLDEQAIARAALAEEQGNQLRQDILALSSLVDSLHVRMEKGCPGPELLAELERVTLRTESSEVAMQELRRQVEVADTQSASLISRKVQELTEASDLAMVELRRYVDDIDLQSAASLKASKADVLALREQLRELSEDRRAAALEFRNRLADVDLQIKSQHQAEARMQDATSKIKHELLAEVSRQETVKADVSALRQQIRELSAEQMAVSQDLRSRLVETNRPIELQNQAEMVARRGNTNDVADLLQRLDSVDRGWKDEIRKELQQTNLRMEETTNTLKSDFLSEAARRRTVEADVSALRQEIQTHFREQSAFASAFECRLVQVDQHIEHWNEAEELSRISAGIGGTADLQKEVAEKDEVRKCEGELTAIRQEVRELRAEQVAVSVELRKRLVQVSEDIESQNLMASRSRSDIQDVANLRQSVELAKKSSKEEIRQELDAAHLRMQETGNLLRNEVLSDARHETVKAEVAAVRQHVLELSAEQVAVSVELRKRLDIESQNKAMTSSRSMPDTNDLAQLLQSIEVAKRSSKEDIREELEDARLRMQEIADMLKSELLSETAKLKTLEGHTAIDPVVRSEMERCKAEAIAGAKMESALILARLQTPEAVVAPVITRVAALEQKFENFGQVSLFGGLLRSLRDDVDHVVKDVMEGQKEMANMSKRIAEHGEMRGELETLVHELVRRCVTDVTTLDTSQSSLCSSINALEVRVCAAEQILSQKDLPPTGSTSLPAPGIPFRDEVSMFGGLLRNLRDDVDHVASDVKDVQREIAIMSKRMAEHGEMRGELETLVHELVRRCVTDVTTLDTSQSSLSSSINALEARLCTAEQILSLQADFRLPLEHAMAGMPMDSSPNAVSDRSEPLVAHLLHVPYSSSDTTVNAVRRAAGAVARVARSRSPTRMDVPSSQSPISAHPSASNARHVESSSSSPDLKPSSAAPSLADGKVSAEDRATLDAISLSLPSSMKETMTNLLRAVNHVNETIVCDGKSQILRSQSEQNSLTSSCQSRPSATPTIPLKQAGKLRTPVVTLSPPNSDVLRGSQSPTTWRTQNHSEAVLRPSKTPSSTPTHGSVTDHGRGRSFRHSTSFAAVSQRVSKHKEDR